MPKKTINDDILDQVKSMTTVRSDQILEIVKLELKRFGGIIDLRCKSQLNLLYNY